MVAGKGAYVLIKIGDGAEPETYATIGGLATTQLRVNRRTVDASTVESGAFHALLSGAGLMDMQLSGSGVFIDSASEEQLRSKAFSGVAANYRLIFSNGDYCSGPFIVTRYDRLGDYDAEELYALTLRSAGTIAFTVA